MLRIEPALPMQRIDPALPTLRIDPALPTQRSKRRFVLTAALRAAAKPRSGRCTR
jgi:hypothetical protein